MKELSTRTNLILWDAAFIIAVLLYCLWDVSVSNKLIIGLQAVMIFSFCIQKHIAAYKLTGKIY